MINNKFIEKSKYKNIKTKIDEITFDSKAEAEYYSYLKGLEKNGWLKILELQPKVYLTKAKILYKPDFKIEHQCRIIYIDVKGKTTAAFQIKKRLWRYYGEGILQLVKKNNFRFETIEEIQSE